jgi:hypothetical protein
LITHRGSFGTDKRVAHSQMLSRRVRNRQGEDESWLRFGMPPYDSKGVFTVVRGLLHLYPVAGVTVG